MAVSKIFAHIFPWRIFRLKFNQHKFHCYIIHQIKMKLTIIIYHRCRGCWKSCKRLWLISEIQCETTALIPSNKVEKIIEDVDKHISGRESINYNFLLSLSYFFVSCNLMIFNRIHCECFKFCGIGKLTESDVKGRSDLIRTMHLHTFEYYLYYFKEVLAEIRIKILFLLSEKLSILKAIVFNYINFNFLKCLWQLKRRVEHLLSNK